MLRKLLHSALALVLTAGLAIAASLTIDNTLSVNRVTNLGSAPVVSVCGTGAAVATGSTDFAGKVTVGTTASNACTLTFSAAFVSAPFCIVQNLTTGAAANVYTTSTTAITWSSALADSTVLHYHCVAPVGG